MTEYNSSATTANTAAASTLSPEAESWFEKRGIEADTVIGCGISSRGEGRGTVLVFPFLEKGITVNHKYRGYNHDTGKFKKFWQDQNPKRTFWNADAIALAVEHTTPLVITEGEMDALSVLEAGYPYVVSVPDGAPKQANDNPIDVRTDLKFDYFWTVCSQLDKVGTIILAGDGDGPGQALNQELSRRIGIERCSRLVYPAQDFNFGTDEKPVVRPCKDLNEVLVKLGAIEVRKLIDTAKPYPMKGIHLFDDYPDAGEPKVFSTGIKGLDKYMMLETGRLMVITGVPQHGKSIFLDCLAYNMARNHGWNVCVGSFETDPKKGWGRKMKKRWRSDLAAGEDRSEEAFKAWIQARFCFIGQNPTGDEDLDLTIDNIIEYAECCVYRYGTRFLALDPWNEIEHCRQRDETETEYINRAIKALKHFARRFDVLVAIVAHPTKMAEKGTLRMPTLYDISGSANWYNKADYGVVLWRDNVAASDSTTLKICKIKEHDYLGKPGTLELALDANSATFSPHVSCAFGNIR